ncbi:P-loop containing nucleoside triphosphate hydrolase protein [Ilyonectria robusta]|uniref:P-loop containing nucleoside triphosphate hydrolase protein n=1 Tax=Ilyonectria robusta TaxID=1079257 RepID=UPI001E8DDDCE|nr:P-loop containing nucleoside triphosphate hydrolase protein [Ilyonectria robusta]KAH8737916.1 P-loop containing nucleoside triphosphate hydrolase protein [Ilyonectria robusta]
MDGAGDDDPFSWEVATVVKVLSAPNRPWAPDPAAIANRVQEEEIDGKTLLTFEHVCSRQELMECLGIRLARHKVAIGELILTLRSKSWAYQQWRQDFNRKQSGFYFDSDGLKNSPTSSLGANGFVLKTQPKEKGLEALPSQPHTNEQPALPAEPTQPEPEPTDTPKPRRLVPIALSSRPLNISNAFIPTEADTLGFVAEAVQKDEQSIPWEEASIGAYLGDGSLTLEALKSPTGSLSSRLLEPTEDTFATAIPNWLPPGRRLAVHRGIMRFLKKNGRQEMLQKQGIFLMRSPTPSDSDTVLDLVDLPDEYDEQTKREMEEERLERERYAAQAARHSLSSERVTQILMDAIDAIAVTWQETKLPKHQRKAYQLWHHAQRKGNRTRQVLDAHTQAKFYDERIKKLCAEIVGETWTKQFEVRDQAKCLEQSIHDKLYNGWLVDMLESRTEPPKPQTIAKPKPQASKRRLDDYLDEEILTSSDEDDFIEPDDEPGVNNGRLMDLDDTSKYGDPSLPAEPVKEESLECIDLTQGSWGMNSPKGPKKTDFVDLTSPIRSDCAPKDSQASNDLTGAPDIPPTIESLGSFEEIGAVTLKQMSKSKDRWKLLICLIWRLPHTRRRALLDFIQEKSTDEAWEEAVRPQMTDPLEDLTKLGVQTSTTIAFDLTRAFLSFYRVKNLKESSLVPLSQKLRQVLEKAKRPWFQPFCSFVKDAAHQFPQDSQIYRADIPEDVLEDDLEDDHSMANNESSQSKRRKVAPKEIIQNKEAVDLRQRELKRVQEQESRRAKLRADLASSGLMSRDRTRLIINESKQDGQSFVYINEEIGKRIKEHQVNGVRFMWNQVVAADTRQGCLLAHTMGLGKTMQVITLLVAIRESSTSSDPSIKAQIPEDLQTPQTLVLCPAGLVDNWMDELLMWAPEGILGPLRRVDAQMTIDERSAAVQEWAKGGGVLVMGYHMLKQMISPSKGVDELLLDKPNIIVADEAHHLKNEKSIINHSCARFRSKSRIALTGSPLANNVEEYRSMIDWVAPNFLGPLAEFREMYATPIQHGLYNDSSGPEKRLALKKLEALKVTVQPKVHRATVKSCLKDDLPPKFEFVLSVPPTPLQSKLYAIYLRGLLENGIGPEGSILQSQLFTITNHLALICNHPRCFQLKVKRIMQGTSKDEDDNGKEDKSFPKSIIQPVLKELKVPDPDLASLSRKVELLTVILDEARVIGDKVLVFSQSLMTIEYLLNLFQMQKRRVSCLTGKTVINKRQEMTKNFNLGDQEVYLISTTAGGVGLNIQGANRVVIFDIKWNPVHEQQAIGRAYRIGQEKTVFVYRFVVAGTFEEDLQSKHVFKTQLASRVVDKKNPVSWSKRSAKLLHEIRPSPVKDLSDFLGKDGILDALIKYKKNGEAVRSILSTDTFEEEDVDAKLSVDELRDVREMVKLNGLRSSNPEEFQKAKMHAAEEEFFRLARMSQSAIHSAQHQQLPNESATSKPHPSVDQSLDGSFDAPDPVGIGHLQSQHFMRSALHGRPQELLPGPFQTSISGLRSVPLPVAGANTYFGTQPQRTTAPVIATTNNETEKETPKVTLGPTTQSTPFNGGNLFSQPQSQPKINFQNRLEARIHGLQKDRLLRIQGEPRNFAKSLTDAICGVRDKLQLGFLPDGRHWKHLEELLDHNKVVISLVSGHWTPSYVAGADKKELESRMYAMNGLPEKEISAQGSRRAHSPDPHNLHNIRRRSMPTEGASQSPHAKEDMDVMREAADNRKRRGVRLPTWANQALSEEQSRAFPALGTVQSLEDRRARPRNESPRGDKEVGSDGQSVEEGDQRR